ncbi:MAG TPA: zf-HC2 domain-containing protein, partial [Chitinispirillaceae bacterium]|nr:zf-HC2 domain-containing protein [Chitinispirillaceae bacterium]
MACSNLEETVLLYSSGELSEKEEKSFEEHMSMCDECRKEFDSYRTEQEKFFTYDVLGEAPSKDVDKEILRVCSDARKKVTGLGIMPVFLKKTIYSLTFFVVGFVVVGYFA